MKTIICRDCQQEFEIPVKKGRPSTRCEPCRSNPPTVLQVSKNGLSTVYLGKAAEHRAMSEMLLRGMEPALVSVDRGADMILPSGLRLQVKAATRSEKGKITWKFVQYRYSKGKALDKVRPPVQPHYYLLWDVTDNRWFVVPAIKVEGRYGVHLNKYGTDRLKNAASYFQLTEYEGRWDLLIEE